MKEKQGGEKKRGEHFAHPSFGPRGPLPAGLEKGKPSG
jgi:hypothetical protein